MRRNARWRSATHAPPGTRTGPTAGPRSACHWRIARRWRGRRQRTEPVSLQILLDRARQREQSLFDLARHVAGVAQGLPAVLEHFRLPGNALHDLVDLAGISAGIRLQSPQLLVVFANCG